MADNSSVQEVKALNALLGPSSESLPDEIRGVVAETTMDYVAALRQVGADGDLIQRYVNNGVEIARDMHTLGMKSGQLKKFLEEKNVSAVKQVVEQRDAQRIAQMQAEQQDIALASTLDTLRATGASAGGATALARAAAQSKRGVAASIEQQEARNAQLRAQGEMQAAQIRQRGQAMAFQAQEAREMTQLDRQASLESSYNQQAAAYGAQSRGMAVQAVGSIASAGLHAYDAGMFKGKTPTTDFSKSVNLEGINKLDYEFKGDNLMTKPGVGAMSNASIAPVNIPDTSTLSLGGVSNPFSSLAGHYTDPNLNNFGSYNMPSLNSLVTGQVLPGGNPYLSPSLMYKIG